MYSSVLLMLSSSEVFLGKKKSWVDSRRPDPFLWFSSPFSTSMSLFHLSSTSYLHQDLQLIPFSPYTQKIQSDNASLCITAILLCYAGPNAPFLALLRFWNCLVPNQNETLYHKPQSPSMHLPFLLFTFTQKIKKETLVICQITEHFSKYIYF